jgi:hypothetical protein
MSREKVIYHDKVYTSYFRVVDKYVNPDRQVSIAYSTPEYFNGNFYRELAPSGKLLGRYKSGEITTEQYRQIYYDETLKWLNPIEVYNQLKGKVLCCWEGRREFCHRHLVLEWLRDNLGEQVIGGEL